MPNEYNVIKGQIVDNKVRTTNEEAGKLRNGPFNRPIGSFHQWGSNVVQVVDVFQTRTQQNRPIKVVN